MGQANARRAQFLAQHPHCCFCGGGAPATTEDHIPARAVFANRQWPEGHVFPACGDCNRKSRWDEELLAWVARISSLDGMEENHKAEFEKLSMSIGRYRPELATKLRLYSRVETRRYFRDRAIPRNAPGLPNEVHLVGMPPEVTEAVERYGTKLAKALHYKFSNVIVPATAKIDCRVYTNAELLTGNQQWLEGLAILRLPAEVVRAGKSLPSYAA